MRQFEHDEVKWLHISSCTSREQELASIKKDSFLALAAGGQLKVTPPKNLAVSDVTTDLKVQQAFTRRGLAYDQSGLMTFSVHARWVEQLFKAMARSVPENFSNVTVQQRLDADKELFLKVADHCRAGIVPIAGQPRPLDIAVEIYRNHTDVLCFTVPFSKRSSASSSSIGPPAVSSTTTLVSQELSNRKRKRDAKAAGKGSKGKAGKGKGGKGDVRMPEGCLNKTSSGKNICFRFNSSVGCSFGKPGGTCMRGSHVCARPGCEAAHSAVNCNKGA